MMDVHIIVQKIAYTMIIQMKNSKRCIMTEKEIHIGQFGGNKVILNIVF